MGLSLPLLPKELRSISHWKLKYSWINTAKTIRILKLFMAFFFNWRYICFKNLCKYLKHIRIFTWTPYNMCLSLILEHTHFLLFWQLISQCFPFGFHLYQRTVRTIISENNLMSHCLGSGSDYRTYWSYLCIHNSAHEGMNQNCVPARNTGSSRATSEALLYTPDSERSR